MRISIKRITLLLCAVILFGTFLLTMAGIFGGRYLYADISASFMAQYAIEQLLCIALLAMARLWKPFIFAVALFCFSAAIIAPAYIPRKQANSEHSNLATISLLLMNVHTSNSDFQSAIRYIQNMNPDILILEEIDDRWVAAVAGVTKQFSARLEIPRQDNFGIALYSKIPLTDIKEQYFGISMVPSITAKLRAGKQNASILATHPLPPTSEDYFQSRNQQLDEISASRNMFDKNLIVIGDLNTTMWSSHYKRFEAGMGVRNARNGFGILPSWPTNLSYMMIPLDHCLVSKSIVVKHIETGPEIGSDHLPLFVTLYISD